MNGYQLINVAIIALFIAQLIEFSSRGFNASLCEKYVLKKFRLRKDLNLRNRAVTLRMVHVEQTHTHLLGRTHTIGFY